MLNGIVKERIVLLNNNLVKVSNADILLTEGNESGAARLKILTDNPPIMFCDLENKKLSHFINQKCADYLIFENVQGVWWKHIFELKKTVQEGSSKFVH